MNTRQIIGTVQQVTRLHFESERNILIMKRMKIKALNNLGLNGNDYKDELFLDCTDYTWKIQHRSAYVTRGSVLMDITPLLEIIPGRNALRYNYPNNTQCELVVIRTFNDLEPGVELWLLDGTKEIPHE